MPPRKVASRAEVPSKPARKRTPRIGAVETRDGRKLPVPHETRQACVRRAQEVGGAQAAREYGVNAATVRKWIQRYEGEDDKKPLIAEGIPPAEKIAALRLAAERNRAASVRALELADGHVTKGAAGEGRAASAVAAALAEASRELEAAAHSEEAHQQRLAEATAREVAAVLRGFAAALGVAEDVAGRISRDLLSQAVAGETLCASPKDVQEVRAAFILEARGELAAERGPDDSALSPSMPAVGGSEAVSDEIEAESEIIDPAEGVTYDDVPPEWRDRYADPGLAVHEYQNALRREKAAEVQPPEARTRRYSRSQWSAQQW